MTSSSMSNDLRPLIYRCPTTGINVITHILAQSGKPVAYLSATAFGLKCPCCGSHHVFQAKDCRSSVEKSGSKSFASRSADSEKVS